MDRTAVEAEHVEGWGRVDQLVAAGIRSWGQLQLEAHAVGPEAAGLSVHHEETLAVEAERPIGGIEHAGDEIRIEADLSVRRDDAGFNRKR